MTTTETTPPAPTTLGEAARVLSVLGIEGEVVDRLAGGASNENFIVETPRGRMVLRIASPLTYADRFALDRWRGYVAHQAAAAAGVAPELLGIALPSGHSVVRFIHGTVIDETTILEGTNLEDAALALRAVHTGRPVECGRFDALVEVDRFVRIAREEGLALPDDIGELHALSREIDAVFAKVAPPLVLCHDDVQLANLIRAEDGRMWVIDWEYGGIGNPYFDLAMLANNAGLDDAGVGRMLGAYAGAVRDADRARVELCRFQAAMREALWSVVAAPVLATGWDYDEWAAQFFGIARTVQESIRSGGLLDRAGPAADDAAMFEGMTRHD